MTGRIRDRIVRIFSGRGHLFLPLAAWTVLLAGSLVFVRLCHAAYGTVRRFPETAEIPAVYALLITTALLAGGTALAGARLAILRCRPRAAALLVGFACFPPLAAATGLLYAFLFFRT